jgi:hypothetical protein
MNHSWALNTLVAFCMLTHTASASWPTDPEARLVVGAMENAFSPRQSIAVGDDDAVWVAWQDSLCTGAVRLQRIGINGSLQSVDGIEVQEDPTCAFHLPPVLKTIGNDAVVSRALSGTNLYPVQRVGADGSALWPVGFSTELVRTLGGVARLPSGDALIVTYGFGSIHADRIDAAGGPVWAKQALVVDGISANLRIIDVVPMSDGGAVVFWDSHLAYTKLIYAMRIQSDGSPAWAVPVQMVAPPPGTASSRHSDPVVASDGQGGVVLFFTHGFETGTTPAPLLMQRVNTDGSLAFPIEGVRVSLGSARQFDVIVKTDQTSGDMLLVWRDGQQANTTVRAQRMSPLGDRLWGDEGVEIAVLDPLQGSFDFVWKDNELSVVIGNQNGVVAHILDAGGQVAAGPWDVYTNGAATNVRAVESGDAVVVSWQDIGFIAAQRLRADGTLGGASCNASDLTQDGELDFFDVSFFLNAFAAMDPVADFTQDDAFDFFDVSAFLAVFGAGCP